MFKPHILAALFAPLLVAACSAQPVAQSPVTRPLPPPQEDGNYRVYFPEEAGPATRLIATAVGDDLAETCGLVRAHFDFDSADPKPQDKVFLKAVADCLNRPTLRDKALTVVGRADSRGTNGYNDQLGMRRANAVRDLLVNAGVSADRIIVSTDGKQGAVGGEGKLYSYGYDRRVDVVTLGIVHAPAQPCATAWQAGC